jgi:pimeloyl-ACP methyl ester carboxylesterase
MTERVMKRAKGDGVSIQVAEWPGKGRSVLCIHGITANCRCWDTIAESMAPSHRVLAMDLRGRGLSDKPDSGYSIAHHCSDILKVLDSLHVEEAVIMGHSLGAYISLAFGAEHPSRVSGVILVDGGGSLSDEQRQKVFAGIKPSLDRLGKVFPTFEAYVEHVKQAPFHKTWSPALDAYSRYEIEEVAGGVRARPRPEHIEEERQNMGAFDAGACYSRVTCPVLILRATEGMASGDDLLLPESAVERMVGEIPHSRLVDLDGTNHYTVMFQPNRERDLAIMDFLEEGEG